MEPVLQEISPEVLAIAGRALRLRERGLIPVDQRVLSEERRCFGFSGFACPDTPNANTIAASNRVLLLGMTASIHHSDVAEVEITRTWQPAYEGQHTAIPLSRVPSSSLAGSMNHPAR
jgi:hypothetical protein